MILDCFSIILFYRCCWSSLLMCVPSHVPSNSCHLQKKIHKNNSSGWWSSYLTWMSFHIICKPISSDHLQLWNCGWGGGQFCPRPCHPHGWPILQEKERRSGNCARVCFRSWSFHHVSFSQNFYQRYRQG